MMRRTNVRGAAALGAAVLLAALGAGCGSGQSDSGGGGSTAKADTDGPIVIGAATAETGILAANDVEPTQALKLRVDEINAAGGIDGRRLVVESQDTRSDLARAGTVAEELIGKGARVLAVTCDFDYGSPAAITAQRRGVPAISLCASDPKFSDKTAIGDLAFTMGTGTDAKASLIAEYAYAKGWRTAYILQDTSLEYTKSLGRYFEARFKELGGRIVGTDRFQGSENVNVRAQITKLKGVSPQPDFVFLPGWHGGGAPTVIKQLRSSGVETPTFSAVALDGKALAETAGDVSGVWYLAYGCFSYCTGDDSEKSRKDAAFADRFAARFGNPPSTSYAQNGYDMASVIAEALTADPNAAGQDLARALQAAKPADTLTEPSFSETCHKPSQRSMEIVEIERGRLQLRDRATVESIPDIGDGNPCATR